MNHPCLSTPASVCSVFYIYEKQVQLHPYDSNNPGKVFCFDSMINSRFFSTLVLDTLFPCNT
ncbi:hypothetical protein M378DRAFT_170354 [Amanita muscaria Koide BX008]|uniref:Uncharacterized protein n=1 Tax=Amanita muscaria (strain Koide BX008) TaxID=946122 RepID=A0A0C2SWX4_AMAMK|nr:hypothetical protein M378DRAFT_170354 [Amanita muscaria Koide BX008]